jgi:hypothetical protein
MRPSPTGASAAPTGNRAFLQQYAQSAAGTYRGHPMPSAAQPVRPPDPNAMMQDQFLQRYAQTAASRFPRGAMAR